VISKNGSCAVAVSAGFVEELKMAGCFAPHDVKSMVRNTVDRKYFIQKVYSKVRLFAKKKNKYFVSKFLSAA
jgi:hypothetical protein